MSFFVKQKPALSAVERANLADRRIKRGVVMRVKIASIIIVSLVVVFVLRADSPQKAPSRLCVVWSSGDPEVAKNVCFMYTLNAKKAGWFDVVHLVVWGPSAKLLAEDPTIQAEMKAMQKIGVVTEACVVCARIFGVVFDLKRLDLEVKGMGKPLSDRLKNHWKVISF
jgi:hypothetical protein